MTPTDSLRALAPESAYVALAKAEFPDRVAASLSDSGVVYRFGDSVVVASRGRDALTRSRDVYMAWTSQSNFSSVERCSALIAAISRRWPSTERVLLRTEGDFAPPPLPTLTPSAKYLWKVPESSSAPPDHDIRPASTTAEWRWIHEALTTALITGYRSEGVELDRGRALRYVRRTYDPRNPRLRTHLALEAGVPVAHATVIMDVEDDVTGTVRDELVDILVAPDAAGRGWGGLLLAAVEREAARRGSTLLGNVVGEPGNPRWLGVVERLHSTGWRPDYNLWAVRPGRSGQP